jgi:hypothetical protein
VFTTLAVARDTAAAHVNATMNRIIGAAVGALRDERWCFRACMVVKNEEQDGLMNLRL